MVRAPIRAAAAAASVPAWPPPMTITSHFSMPGMYRWVDSESKWRLDVSRETLETGHGDVSRETSAVETREHANLQNDPMDQKISLVFQSVERNHFWSFWVVFGSSRRELRSRSVQS